MASSLYERMFSVSHPRKLWLVTGAHAINEFYSVALPPILPLLVNDFSISYGEAGALLTIFFVMYSIFQVPAGLLADRIGQRWLLAAGMVTLSAGILLAAAAQDYWTLVLAQALAGIGGSTYHPTGMSLISDLETDETEGKAMGIHGLGGVIGTALAPAFIGGLAALFDWRLALTLGAVVGIAYTAAFLFLFRDLETTGDTTTVESDGGGPSTAPTETPGRVGNWRSRLASHVTVPLEWWVLVLFLANLVIASEIGAVRTFITTYLIEYAGMTAVVANAIFFVMLVGAGISSIVGGTLADLVDRRVLGVTTMTGSMIAIGATPVIPAVPLALFGWFFLIGLMLWAAVPAMNALISQYSQEEFSGSLFGVMLTAASLGGAGGPLLFGVVAEQFGLGAAFPIVGGVCAVAVAAFLFLGRL